MSKPTLEEFIDAVKERCEKATKGPWEVRWDDDSDADGYHYSRWPSEIARVCNFSEVDGVTDDNIAFISHSRTDIEALVGMVEMLWRAHDNLVTVKPSHLQAQVVALIPPAEEVKP